MGLKGNVTAGGVIALTSLPVDAAVVLSRNRF